MTATEIKKAVNNGLTVHCKNSNYKVIQDPKTGFLIKSENNENYIGLTWQDGKTLNGKEEDFYIKNSIDEALRNCTREIFDSLDNGDEMKLNGNFSIYKYLDEEHYTIRDSENDIFCVQTDGALNLVFTEI